MNKFEAHVNCFYRRFERPAILVVRHYEVTSTLHHEDEWLHLEMHTQIQVVDVGQLTLCIIYRLQTV